VRYPCRTPNGLFPINAPMLGGITGYGVDIVDCGCTCEYRPIELKN
jgi:hypothetical protein